MVDYAVMNQHLYEGNAKEVEQTFRDDSGRQLSGVGFFPGFVPTAVELASEALDPGLGRLVRRMHAAGRHVDHEGAVGRGRLLVVDPGDRVVGQTLVEEFAGPLGVVHPGIAPPQPWLPLVNVAANESIEVVEA